MAFAVVRIRGQAKIRGDVVETLLQLRLNRVNHCVILPEDATTRGMLQKAKDYITWGEVAPETIAHLLLRRGELTGAERLSDEFVRGHSTYPSLLAFAKALGSGEARLTDLPLLKPVLRLPPPRRGYGKIKTTFKLGGNLGYRGPAMEALLERMLPPAKAKGGKERGE